MKKLTVRGISTHEESKGEWKYGYLIEDEGVSYIINGVAEANDEYISIGEWCSVDPETLGLSTGLPDAFILKWNTMELKVLNLLTLTFHIFTQSLAMYTKIQSC